MNLKNKKIIFLVLVIIAASITSFLIINKNIGSSSFISQTQNDYNYTYGTFNIIVYNASSGTIKRVNITGILFHVNNINDQSLTIISISNSTFTINNPPFYIQTTVPLPNGSITSGYTRSYEIYIGYETIILPTNGLSPGYYTITLSDGTTIPVYIK